MRPQRFFRPPVLEWLLILALGAWIDSVFSQEAPASTKGVMTYRLSNGPVVLAQTRYEIEFAQGSFYLPVPPPLRHLGCAAAPWLEAVLMDTSVAGEDTPRLALAAINATANFNFDGVRLGVHLRCPPKDLSRASGLLLDILAVDRLREPYWSQAALRRRDSFGRVAVGWDWAATQVSDALLAGHNLKESAVILDGGGITLEELTRFWRTVRNLRELKVVLTGRGDPPEMVKQLMEHSKNWQALEKTVEGPAPAPAVRNTDFAEWSLPVCPPRVVIYLRGPGRASAKLPAFLSACSLLTDGMTSLAGRQFLDPDKPLPVMATTHFVLGTNASLFIVELQAPVAVFDDIELRFFAAMAVLHDGLWLVVDGERATNQAFVHVAQTLTTPERFHAAVLESGRPVDREYFNRWANSLNQLKKTDIASAAKEYLTLNRCSVLELPGTGASRRGFTASSFRETLNALLPITAKELAEKIKKNPDIPLQPVTEDSPPQEDPERTGIVMSSGVLRGPNAALQEQHRFSLIWLYLAWPGGALIEGPEQRGLGELALLQRLLSCKDPQERLLLERLERLGVLWRISEAEEYTSLELVFPVWHRRPVMEQVLRMLHRQEIPEGQLVSPSNWGQLFGTENTPSPASQARIAALGAFYGKENPYGRAPGRLTSLTAAAVGKFYAEHFYRVLPAIGLVGDFEGTELLSAAGENVSGSEFAAAKLPLLQPEFPEGQPPKDTLIGAQLVDMIFPGPYSGDADVLRMEILRWLNLAPGSGAPFEMKSWTTPLLSRGCIHLQFITDGSEVPTKVGALASWIKSLPEKSIDTWRLAMSIRQAELDYSTQVADPVELAHWLGLNVLWKSRLWDESERDKTLHHATKEQIRALINRCFSLGRYAVATIPLTSPVQNETKEPLVK